MSTSFPGEDGVPAPAGSGPPPGCGPLPSNVVSITRGGVTIQFAPPPPDLIAVGTSACRFCQTRLRVRRGRCSYCGAPERLAGRIVMVVQPEPVAAGQFDAIALGPAALRIPPVRPGRQSR